MQFIMDAYTLAGQNIFTCFLKQEQEKIRTQIAAAKREIGSSNESPNFLFF